MSIAYNFSACAFPMTAARVASLHTVNHIEKLFSECFNVNVNVVTKYNKPSKCHAAMDLVTRLGNEPAERQRAIIDRIDGYYKSAQEWNASGAQGRPITQYHHDENATAFVPNKKWNGKRKASTFKVERVPTETQAEETETYTGELVHCQFPVLLRYLRAKQNVFLPGPAGSGKTTAARKVAETLGLPFYFSNAVENVYTLLGFRDAGGNVARTPFREAYENGGVFLFDEVDASNPFALVAMNAAIENGVCAFPDGIINKHDDFILIASGNTYGSGATAEYVGRTKLDAATIDRFAFLAWDYDERLERNIVASMGGSVAWVNKVQSIRAKVRQYGMKHVVSPRASIDGARMLLAGCSESEVLTARVYKGLPAEEIRKLSY